jgi:photosystem II stability/assembly factor-like uncharacterized protein
LISTSTAWPQFVEPKRPAPPPSYAPNGAVKWPEFKPRPGPVASMKLLAPNRGWALSMRRILWTDNGGASWKDITPSDLNDAEISGIFFLDASHGWVVFARGEPDVLGGMTLDLASTENGGVSWSVAPMRLPDWLLQSLVGVGADIAFADPRHGWLVLQSGISQISVGHGSLLTTSDGGKSWQSPRPPDHRSKEDIGRGSVGPIVLVTPQFGWMVLGGEANDELGVTRDGAKTWQRIELKSPVRTDQMQKFDAEWGPHDYAAYTLPSFEDLKHGYVCVTYPGVVVLFATNDGGITWKADRMLMGLHAGSMGTTVVSAVVNSTWITARAAWLGSAGFGLPQLKKLNYGANVTDTTMLSPEASGIMQMTFITPNEGWVLTSETRLLSTNDGGATWTDISPPR